MWLRKVYKSTKYYRVTIPSVVWREWGKPDIVAIIYDAGRGAILIRNLSSMDDIRGWVVKKIIKVSSSAMVSIPKDVVKLWGDPDYVIIDYIDGELIIRSAGV